MAVVAGNSIAASEVPQFTVAEWNTSATHTIRNLHALVIVDAGMALVWIPNTTDLQVYATKQGTFTLYQGNSSVTAYIGSTQFTFTRSGTGGKTLTVTAASNNHSITILSL